jgi:3-oxo-5alpha-steroid 4-dehydrogenase
MYSEVLTKGVLINMKGRRFIGEDNYGSFIACALIHGNPVSFLVFDDAVWSEVPDAVKDYVTLAGQADTVAELVTNLGLNAAMVESTLSTYNQFAAEGQDPEHQKNEHYLVPLETAPFYAIPFMAEYGNAFTTGGLHINTRAEVVDADGEPIPGLYAAGRNAFAVTAQNYPGSGTSVGEALIFGRIAGQGAAASESWS